MVESVLTLRHLLVDVRCRLPDVVGGWLRKSALVEGVEVAFVHHTFGGEGLVDRSLLSGEVSVLKLEGGGSVVLLELVHACMKNGVLIERIASVVVHVVEERSVKRAKWCMQVGKTGRTSEFGWR